MDTNQDGARIAGRPSNPIDPSVDFRDRRGPFDVVGDVHGCYDELRTLLDRLGYDARERAWVAGGDVPEVTPPDGRTLVFLGDLVDRGPKVVSTLKLAMAMRAAGTALCVPGNHDDKLRRSLLGRPVTVNHGLTETLAQLAQEPPSFARAVLAFLSDLPPYLILDGGRLVVAHAGMPRSAQGRDDKRTRDLALYGEATGARDADGYPVRVRWAERYDGAAFVVYGHTGVPEPDWIGNTVNIDTGCVFGGLLSALRYPERDVVSVPAERTYDAGRASYQTSSPTGVRPR